MREVPLWVLGTPYKGTSLMKRTPLEVYSLSEAHLSSTLMPISRTDGRSDGSYVIPKRARFPHVGAIECFSPRFHCYLKLTEVPLLP